LKYLNQFITLFFTFIVFSTYSFAHESHTDGDTVNIGYANYAPYSFSNHTGATGIEVDIINSIFNELNIAVSHQILPWKRVQANTEKGLLDAYVAVSTPKRLSYTVPAQTPIITGRVVAFLHRDNLAKSEFTNVEKIQDLRNFRIGGINGSGWLTKNLPGMDIRRVVSMRALAKMLLRKRVDFVPENMHILQYYLAQVDPKQDITYKTLDIPAINLHFLMSKKSHHLALIPKIDTILKRMQASGELEKIYARYR
jgi:polar amino acid transport system substrate-binding protein